VELIPFTKLQATGNDFVLIDARVQPEHSWPALARDLCDRHRGVGGDGLLVLTSSARADARMLMFNPDGTEDMCGNGLRGVMQLLGAASVRVETLAGIIEGTTSGAAVSVRLPPARFDAGALPATQTVWDLAVALGARTVRLFAASTGTPHAVIFGNQPNEVDFATLSPLIETHELFPERTSVSWATVLQPDHAQARVWERGVGETLACGTGACAIAAISNALGLTGRHLVVTMRGGQLTVDLEAYGGLTLTGAATTVFQGQWHEFDDEVRRDATSTG